MKMRVPAGDMADDADELRYHVHRFMRSFGLLVASRTPCGHPLPISYAHALMVLLDADRRGEPSCMRDLATELKIDKSNVTRLCRRMVRGGHLELARTATDGRVRRLQLTRPGRELAAAVEVSSRERFREISAALPTRARRGLFEGLEALNQVIVGTNMEDRS